MKWLATAKRGSIAPSSFLVPVWPSAELTQHTKHAKKYPLLLLLLFCLFCFVFWTANSSTFGRSWSDLSIFQNGDQTLLFLSVLPYSTNWSMRDHSNVIVFYDTFLLFLQKIGEPGGELEEEILNRTDESHPLQPLHCHRWVKWRKAIMQPLQIYCS